MWTEFWKELFSPPDSYGSIRILFLVLYVLGLTPFMIRGPPARRVINVSWLGFVNAFVHLTFFTVCFMYAFVRRESIVSYFFQTEISKIGDTLQKFIGMFGMLLLFGMSLIERHKIIQFVHMMAQADELLSGLGVDFNYRHAQRFVLTQIVFVTGLNLVYICSSFGLLYRNGIWASLAANVSFFWPHVFLLAVVMLFTTCTVRLKLRLRMVNKVRGGETENEMEI